MLYTIICSLFCYKYTQNVRIFCLPLTGVVRSFRRLPLCMSSRGLSQCPCDHINRSRPPGSPGILSGGNFASKRHCWVPACALALTAQKHPAVSVWLPSPCFHMSHGDVGGSWNAWSLRPWERVCGIERRWAVFTVTRGVNRGQARVSGHKRCKWTQHRGPWSSCHSHRHNLTPQARRTGSNSQGAANSVAPENTAFASRCALVPTLPPTRIGIPPPHQQNWDHNCVISLGMDMLNENLHIIFGGDFFQLKYIWCTVLYMLQVYNIVIHNF